MQAFVLHGIEDLRLGERPEPQIGPKDVLVDIKRIGICGSDVHYYLHYKIGSFIPQHPLVLGHEFAGDVVAVGSEVDTVAVGDRVTAEPSVECRQCGYCRAGRYNLCDNLKFIGTAATIPHIDGAFGEQIVVPESNCYKLDERLDYGAGAMAEPLAVGANAVMRSGSLGGRRVLITGGGTIGQMVLAVAQIMGAGEITVSDIDPFSREFSLEQGAAAAFDPRDEEATKEITGTGFDVLFEASGSPAALSFIYKAAAKGARIVQVGTQPDEVTLPANLVMSKELTVFGSMRYAHVFGMVLDLMSTGRIDGEKFITKVFPYEKMAEAMKSAVAKNEIIKVQVSRE